MSFPVLEVRNPEFADSQFARTCPSIAQLEERGTVKENTVRSQGHWFDPGSEDFLLVAASFRGTI